MFNTQNTKRRGEKLILIELIYRKVGIQLLRMDIKRRKG